MMHLMKVVGTFKLLLVGYVLGIVNDVLAVLSPSLKRKLAIFLERSNSYGKGKILILILSIRCLIDLELVVQLVVCVSRLVTLVP